MDVGQFSAQLVLKQNAKMVGTRCNELPQNCSALEDLASWVLFKCSSENMTIEATFQVKSAERPNTRRRRIKQHIAYKYPCLRLFTDV